MLRALYLLILIFLSGCAKEPTLDITFEQQSHKTIELNSWFFRGRLLVKSDDVLSANIQWQHEIESDVLSLYGVLGLGKKKILLNDRGVSLDEGKGFQYISANSDVFIAQQLGISVPVKALTAWVLGQPLKSEKYTAVLNGFEQLGWKIIYDRYKETPLGFMPHKLKASKDKMKLTLIVERWEK